MIIGVTGCLAQEVQDDFIKKTPYVDLVLGNQNIGRIPDLIERIRKRWRNSYNWLQLMMKMNFRR